MRFGLIANKKASSHRVYLQLHTRNFAALWIMSVLSPICNQPLSAQDDSGRNVNVLEGNSIGHCEKTFLRTYV
jgi:hypothetical protein